MKAGNICRHVAMMIDGFRSADEIASALISVVSPVQVFDVVRQLERLELLYPVSWTPPFSAEPVRWRETSPAQLLRRLVAMIGEVVHTIFEVRQWDDCPTYTYAAMCSPRSGDRKKPPIWIGVSGRGSSRNEAVIGCLCEAAERYSAMWPPGAGTIRRSY